MPRPDVTGVLGPERDAFLETLGGLAAPEWGAATECPAWSVKGIALHVLGDDLSLLARQRDAATPGVFLFAEDNPGRGFRELLNGFNEQWVRAAEFLSPALVIEMLRVSGDWTARFYTDVDPEAPGEPVMFFGPTDSSPYWHAIAREYVERWVHHQQVRRAVGRPDLGHEFLRPALEVVVWGLAGNVPDLGAHPGARLALAVPDVGSWTLRRDDGRWSVVDGDPGEADAVLRLPAALATPVFSKALSRDDVAAAFTVAGDAELGERALAVVAGVAARR